MADRPRLLPFDKEHSDKFWATPPGLSERASTGVAGHVFNTLFMPLRKPLIPPFPHFDPFGTEFCEPGRVSHPDPNRQFTKILPAYAGVPDVHARVGI